MASIRFILVYIVSTLALLPFSKKSLLGVLAFSWCVGNVSKEEGYDEMCGETMGGGIITIKETMIYAKPSINCVTKRLFGLLHLIVLQDPIFLQVCSICYCFKVKIFCQVLDRKV